LKTLDASKLRESLAGILERVRDTGEVVIVARYRKPIAALVPLDRLETRERRSLASRGARNGVGTRGAAPAPERRRHPG
jgi:prevent-host-death family protein